MPKRASTINQHLTNYARGLSQDLSSSLAEFIAPTVLVPGSNGQYKRFSDKNMFQIVDTSRALGGPAKRIEFDADDPYYNCKPQALEIPIDDSEEDASGADDMGVREGKTKTLVSTAVLSHEVKVFNIVNTSVAAVGSRGVWSSDSNDPVAEIDEQIEAIAIETGMMPNRLVFGIGAWRVFRNHPLVKARQPGAELIGLSTSQATSMMLNPGIELRVGVLSKDTTKFGKAKAAVNIVGAEVYIFFNSPSPTRYDASFAKTFTLARGGIQSVREYRQEGNRSDILAVDWSEDVEVVSTPCIRRLTIS